MSNDEFKLNREMLMLRNIQVPRIGASLNQSDEPKSLLIFGTKPNIPDLNKPYYDSERGEENEEKLETVTNLKSFKAQNAHHGLPKLMTELEVEIFSRVPCFLNKQFSQLPQSCEIFRIRRERGRMQPYVCMLSGGEKCWTMFDKDFKKFGKLPEIPFDYCFHNGDKETISAGTHLIVIGADVNGIVVWRYELEMGKWIKDHGMITPRVMYGSASRGTDAFFAGGIRSDENMNREVVNLAEKYNADTKTWTLINGMHKRRKFSSGCFLHGEFYVLGGRDENDKYLTCGESYNEMTDSWTLIPDMLKDMQFMSPQSPPLIAVVNDNLYLLETWLNEFWIYNINTNTWKKLGAAPVKADAALGWGIAFKSIGDRLLVIGASAAQSWHTKMSVYTCLPSPNMEELIWEEYKHCCDGVQLDHFIRNCCVMFA